MKTGREAKRLFLEASELERADRGPFLEELERRDPALGGRVRDLLSAHERAEATVGRLVEEPSRGLELPAPFGPFELVRELGSGGAGVVYEARQPDLGRTVAVKLLRAGRLATAAEVQRFHVEARIAASLDHPGIVPVYETGTHDGRHFISMKLVEGPSLERCADDYRDPRAAARLVVALATAVDHGHRRGVLHRDLKPSNILIDVDGRPFIADFGTAKVLGGGSRTMTGVLMGTPGYMAPEQVAGSGEVTVATDVYALGCILYELLVGRSPHEADDLAETLHRVKHLEPARVRALRPEVDHDLATICHTCLFKDPAKRYPSAAVLAEDLERWLDHLPIVARPATLLERARLAWRRSPVIATLGVAVGALCAVLVIGAIASAVELRDRLERVRAAEQRASEQLRTAYLAEARALRRGRTAERSARGIELVRRAAAIRPGTDLVSEAAAHLAVTDLVTSHEFAHDLETEGQVAFDRAQERYVVCAPDGRVELRETSTGELILELPGNDQEAHTVQFSRDGRYVALTRHGPSYEEPRFDVWNLEAGEIAFTSHSVPVSRFVDFVPGGDAVVLALEKSTLLEHDLVTGEERALVRFDEGTSPFSVRFSPDGTRFVVTTWGDGPLRIYSRSGELELLAAPPEPTGFMHASWSADGAQVGAGGGDFRGYVWDATSGELVTTLEGHESEVVWLLFPRPGLIASYSWDGTTRLWDAHSAEQLLYLGEELLGLPAAGTALPFVSQDAVRLRDVRHGEVLRTFYGHARKDPNLLAVHPDGRLFASGGYDGVILWDLATGARLDEIEEEDVLTLDFGLDETLYVGSDRGLARWTLEQGRAIGPPEWLMKGRCIAFDLDRGGTVLTALSHRTLRVLSPDGVPREVSIDRQRGGTALAVRPDGRQVAMGNWRGSGARVFDLRTGEQLKHFVPEVEHCAVAFTPDGSDLVVNTRTELRLYRSDSWELRWVVRRETTGSSSPVAICVSPDGRLIGAIVEQWKVGLFARDTGERVAVLEPPEHQNPRFARITPDGRSLLVGTSRNRILIWDLVKLQRELADLGLQSNLAP